MFFISYILCLPRSYTLEPASWIFFPNIQVCSNLLLVKVVLLCMYMVTISSSVGS